MALAIFADPLFDAFLASVAVSAAGAIINYLQTNKSLSLQQQSTVSQQQFEQASVAISFIGVLISVLSLLITGLGGL